MQHSVHQQSAPVRRQTWGTMTTEYQERFLPPRCYTAVVTMQKNPDHPLKETDANMSTFGSYYHKCMKNPPKPSMPPKERRRSSGDLHFVASDVEDYTSVYKNDFRAWEAQTLQPFKPRNSLKVNQGLVTTDSDDKDMKSAQAEANSDSVPQEPKPQPFESSTSYRTDYVAHPVQPRTRREKPVHQTNIGLPLVSAKPKMPWDINREIFDEASEFFKQFKTWSLETKFHGHSKAKESSSPDDHNKYLSTTHADYTAHQCQRTKPFLPPRQTSERSKEPFQATTTMREDYKAWDIPRRLPVIPKGELECPKKPQSRAENGAFCSFECVSTGTSSPHKRVTWADGICEECPETRQIISCMVSSRN